MLSVRESRLRRAAVATRYALHRETDKAGKPSDVEIVIATLASAYRVLQKPKDVTISSPLASFMELGCRVDGNAPDERGDASSERIMSAQSVISIFDELATAPPGSRFDPAKDKAVLDLAVKQFMRTGVVNNRAIGRAIGLSHVQVAERKRTRCERIMGILRKEFPAFFQLHSPRRPKEYSHVADAISCGGRPPRRPFRQTGLGYVAGA
jgi:hypothetical protein